MGVKPLNSRTPSWHNFEKGNSAEGFIYFRPGDDTDDDVPQQPLTTLWYGPRLLELPVDITCDS